MIDTAPQTGSDADAQTFELTFGEKERELLATYYAAADMILEYGSGGSTVLAADLGRQVISVESDAAWAARMSAHLADKSDIAQVHHVNIGPTGNWGWPTNPREHRRFPAYALSVWDRADFRQPDLVLIDGRFRASCLVAVMLRTTTPVTVLFDDYVPRDFYHGVERIARKEQTVGRLARFTVTPGPIPPELLTQAITWFTDPR